MGEAEKGRKGEGESRKMGDGGIGIKVRQLGEENGYHQIS